MVIHNTKQLETVKRKRNVGNRWIDCRSGYERGHFAWQRCQLAQRRCVTLNVVLRVRVSGKIAPMVGVVIIVNLNGS